MAFVVMDARVVEVHAHRFRRIMPNLLFAYRHSTGSERIRPIGHTAYPLKKPLEHLEVNR